jgi:TPP-dependent pyruvate/acetoin dehydrogenase alpha subunit
MLTIRRFEEALMGLHREGAFRGHYHVAIGQESSAVAVCEALRPDDVIFTTHRNHAHLVARGADPTRVLAEILGRSGGFNGGRGGTLHVAAPDLNVPVTSALVGGNLPIATGAALALGRRYPGRVVAAFFGDGALEEGAFAEAMNLAALWRVPALYVCENNSLSHEKRRPGQYPSSRLSTEDLAALPSALGVPSISVAGSDLDPLVVLFDRLVVDIRNGSGPRFVEVRFERWPGNYDLWPSPVGAGTDLAQPADDAWSRDADPLLRAVRAHPPSPERLAEIQLRVRTRIDDAVKSALKSPLPHPGTVAEHVTAPSAS